MARVSKSAKTQSLKAVLTIVAKKYGGQVDFRPLTARVNHKAARVWQLSLANPDDMNTRVYNFAFHPMWARTLDKWCQIHHVSWLDKHEHLKVRKELAEVAARKAEREQNNKAAVAIVDQMEKTVKGSPRSMAMIRLLNSAQALLDFLFDYPHQYATDISGFEQDLEAAVDAVRKG